MRSLTHVCTHCTVHPPLAHCRLAALLEAHGFVPAQQWVAAWEAAWQRNLRTCDGNGNCLIQVT